MEGELLEQGLALMLAGMGTVFVRTGIYRTQQPRTLEEVPDITLPGLSGLAEAIIRRWG